ncbi:Glutamate receptor-interacting protein 2 [Geodia barretti]|uniref:Glutamate receptor-interacting protein 2 n=1 Tax=Geodia barretti TaxID=519541 RepID=A0AA35SLJ1_GEOBA|nr:Glutamate receptor-interacting protein 2 [Geodia barretti]
MAKLLLACLKPLTTDDDAGSTPRTTTNGSPDGYQSSAASSSQERRKVAYVELLRRSREPFGIGVEGGTDRHQPAHIAHLRPGGVADKSQALQTGDRILSINGTSTEHLMRSEIAALLDNAGNVVNLEIAYEASPDEEEDESGVLKKTAFLTLTRERNSFGFTISGGSKERRPITVSHVAVGSSAFRHGVLKAGDRVLQINGSDVTAVSQLEAVTLLQSSDDTCTLEIEYDITVHDELLESRGPLQVDLIKPKGASLGISLSGALHLGQPMYISKVKEAGIAERCGALHVRDQLVSINGVTLDNKTIRDAVRLLARSDFNVRLEIIPAHNLTIVPDLSQEEALSDTLSRLSDPHAPHLPGRQSQLSVTSSGSGGHHMLCHPETMRVQLKSDDIGFGLSLHGGVSGKRYRPIKIAVIEDGGPAALAGVLQVGDRIISLNGVNVDGVATAHQALKLVQEGGDVLDMEVIFDVTDAVVPTSGTFDVKMVKTSSLNLGITINGSDKREDNIWISSLKKGGIACRMGTLKPGDVILAINGQSMQNCNLREAAHALRNAGDVVTLTISKECCERPTTGLTPSEAVIFSVELHSDGLPLGISLTGSNHQPQPVFIARISEGGVAHRTGALKVGDRIMAINGQSLFGKTLRDAVFMLQNAGDAVTLKISKLNRRSQ